MAPAPAAITPSAPSTRARSGSGGQQAAHSSAPSASQGSGNEREAASVPDVPGPAKSTANVNDSSPARQPHEQPETGSASSSEAEAKQPASSAKRPRAELCARAAMLQICTGTA